MEFVPGRVIQRREVLHGRVWMEHPVTVVDDRDGVLAVLLEPGSVFAFAEHPFGVHPWAAHQAWSATTVLQLHRDGDPYSVWKFFADGVFTHWYINVEAPIVRRPDGTGGGWFDTADHGIDIVAPADGSPWRWKDADDPEAMAAAGRITLAEAEQIHAAADTVAARLDADDRWWEPWDRWQPGDPAPPRPGRQEQPVTTTVIRSAAGDDLAAILALADVRRRQYAGYQPRLWRPAPDATARQAPYLAALIADPAVICLVAVSGADLVGYAVGQLTAAPPVYDPGGPTCMVDDFTVADPGLWATVGVDLLAAVTRTATDRGAAQVVVVTAARDDPKRAALDRGGLAPASEWWVMPTSRH